MTTAKSCISAFFTAAKPGASAGPSRWVVTRYFGVGPDVGDAVGEIERAWWSEVRPGQLLAAVSAERGTGGVDMQIGLPARQRGGVVGERRRRVV
jgi:hypothetical protein